MNNIPVALDLFEEEIFQKISTEASSKEDRTEPSWTGDRHNIFRSDERIEEAGRGRRKNPFRRGQWGKTTTIKTPVFRKKKLKF